MAEAVGRLSRKEVCTRPNWLLRLAWWLAGACGGDSGHIDKYWLRSLANQDVQGLDQVPSVGRTTNGSWGGWLRVISPIWMDSGPGC